MATIAQALESLYTFTDFQTDARFFAGDTAENIATQLIECAKTANIEVSADERIALVSEIEREKQSYINYLSTSDQRSS